MDWIRREGSRSESLSPVAKRPGDLGGLAYRASCCLSSSARHSHPGMLIGNQHDIDASEL